jgi:outer membrane protein assembly factor BamD (BamD/ComL family)
MRKTTVLCLFLVLLISWGCGPSREKSAERIGALENSLYSPNAPNFNKQKADSLIAMYLEYVEDNPGDSLSPGYLFKAANLSMNSSDGTRSLELFDKYLSEYPEKPKAPMCLFFKAFIYENIRQDLTKARETYLLFIQKYPDNEFARDAKMALMNLGKTPDQLVREFEERNRADSIRKADSLAKSRVKK